jgi:hypothetical protein
MRRRTNIPADALRRIGLDEASHHGNGGSAPWPTLAEEARYGLAGDALEAIEPHTEADPMAVLTNILVAFGNAAGRSAHVKVGDPGLRHAVSCGAGNDFVSADQADVVSKGCETVIVRP